jgi:hypothetical protein
VYQQLGLASGYTSSVLGAIGQTAATPALPNFERKKRPSDCFRRIGAMIDRVEVIVARAGLSMFDLTVGAVNPDRVLPSDVYDLASLLVSELAYLHGRLPGALPPIVPTYAQQVSRLPAHVYQLAGLVESQLAALQSAIEAKPHALER